MRVLRSSLAALAAATVALVAAPTANAQQVSFTEQFDSPVPLGSFGNCHHDPDTPGAYCGGLPASYRANWWAYPSGWHDTATQRSYRVGGTYDPERTVWVNGGQLHIRMFRDGNGPVHSAALVPRATMGVRYGTFTERFRVSHVEPGYKSAHLLWPTTGTCPDCEIDFPESEYTGTIHAFTHTQDGRQDSFDTGQSWSAWHISRIEWTAGSVRYYLDGRLVGQSTRGVPDQPMTWVLQNEAALEGLAAAPNSWTQLDIDYVSATASR